MDRLSTLRAEATDVATRIDSLTALDTDNQSDLAARDLELTGLTERAQKLAGSIDFEVKGVFNFGVRTIFFAKVLRWANTLYTVWQSNDT